MSHSEPTNYLISALKNTSEDGDSWDDGNIRMEFVVLEILVAIFAILGNSMVIFVFIKEKKRLRKKSNYHIISLACADFCVGIFGIPLAILLVNFSIR